MCINGKIYGCKMKALASPPAILFIGVAVAIYIVPLVSFSVYRLKTVSVWHVRNRSNPPSIATQLWHGG